MWTLHRQQQQCGAQIHARSGSRSHGVRQPGEAPGEAVADREAQDHEQAGETLQPGDYPASPIEDRDEDNTSSAPGPQVQWDEVVQPERQQSGETELEQDERGEDAEQVADPQAEQALREAAMDQDAGELDEAGRLDRND